MNKYNKPSIEVIDLASRGVFVDDDGLDAFTRQGIQNFPTKDTGWTEEDFDEADDGWGW